MYRSRPERTGASEPTSEKALMWWFTKDVFFTYIIKLKKKISSNKHLREVDEDDGHKTMLSAFLQFNFPTLSTGRVKKKTIGLLYMYKMLFVRFFFRRLLLYLLPFHRKVVCLSSMKNRLKLLQRISFLRFAFRSFVYFLGVFYFLLLLLLRSSTFYSFSFLQYRSHSTKHLHNSNTNMYHRLRECRTITDEYTLQQFVYIRHVFVTVFTVIFKTVINYSDILTLCAG